MRIVHITHYLVPELGYQELFLAQEQVRVGHQVTIITSNLKLSRDEYKIQKHMLGSRRYACGKTKLNGVQLIRLPAPVELATRLWLLGLTKAIAVCQPELVIVHGITNFTALRVARLHRLHRGFRLFLDEHMVYSLKRAGLLSDLYYGFFRRFISPRLQAEAERFIAISPETVRYMELEYGIPLQRIELAPLGVDPRTFFHSAEWRTELRARWGLDEGHVVAIYAGKISPVKGLHYLIEAAIQLWPAHPNLRLLIVGNADPAYAARLKAQLKAAGRENDVIWEKAVANDRLYRYYSAADFGVWPAHLSITQLEAAACELAIIVTDDEALSNRIANGNGFAVSQGNVEQLAAMMCSLIQNPAQRREMGTRGRILIETQLNWATLAKAYS